MERDLDKNPYSVDEKRVAEFLFERGAGGGDDPIGFILASYAYLVNERNESRDETRQLRIDNARLRDEAAIHKIRRT